MLNKIIQKMPFELRHQQAIQLTDEQWNELQQRRDWLSYLAVFTNISIYMSLLLFIIIFIYILFFSSPYVTLEFLGLNLSPFLFFLFSFILFFADIDFLQRLPKPQWQSSYDLEQNIVKACLYFIFPLVCIISFFLNIILLSKLWGILF